MGHKGHNLTRKLLLTLVFVIAIAAICIPFINIPISDIFSSKQAESGEIVLSHNEVKTEPIKEVSAAPAKSESQKSEQIAKSEPEIKPQDKSDKPQSDSAKEVASSNTQSLQDKVNAITSSYSDAQKAAYQKSLDEREAQVNSAMNSIASNSKIYLSPLLSTRAVVVYFSVPTKTNKLMDESSTEANLLRRESKSIDLITGATKVKKSDKASSITQDGLSALASVLSNETGATLYQIGTTVTYPRDPIKLYDFAFDELANRKYPELTDDNMINLRQFDTFYICFDNWWGTLPAAVYSFFEKYDLSGKTVIPVCLHSGDGYANTLNTIATLEPNATIYKYGFIVSKQELLAGYVLQNGVRNWLTRISPDFL